MSAAFVICIGAAPAGACVMNPDVEYDDVRLPEAFVVRARLEKFAQSTKGGAVCYEGTYAVLETLSGDPPNPFRFKECIEAEGSAAVTLIPQFKQMYGFEKGVEVIAAFTSRPRGKGLSGPPMEPGSLRMLVPSCWGPVHANLDIVTPEQKAQILDEWREPLGGGSAN